MLAPDIGSLVIYGKNETAYPWHNQFRVDGWLKKVTIEIPEWLRLEGEEPTKVKLQWCTREEATHLGLHGIGGAIAPIEECEVTGIVDWPASIIGQYRDSAIEKIGEFVFLRWPPWDSNPKPRDFKSLAYTSSARQPSAPDRTRTDKIRFLRAVDIPILLLELLRLL